MTSVLELTDWLDKQRRGYHKHDGFPEHPVRVLHHAEYFAGDHETPESILQPTIGEEESVVEQTPIDIPRIEDTRKQIVGTYERREQAWSKLQNNGYINFGWRDLRDIKDIEADRWDSYDGPLKRDVFYHPVLGVLEVAQGTNEIIDNNPTFNPELRNLEFLSSKERLLARQNYNLTFMSGEAKRRWKKTSEKYDSPIEEIKQKVVAIAQPLVDNSDIWVRVPQSRILGLIKSGRFKAVSESRKMGMGKSSRVDYYLEAREKAESNLFGVPIDKDHESRPIYGYLSDHKDGYSAGYRDEQSVDNYGTIAIKLRSSVRDNTTITFGDSLDINSGTVGGRTVPSLIHDVKAESMLGDMAVAGSLDKELNSILDTSHDYVEAQIHGGLNIDDIEEIIFHEEPTSKTILKKLDSLQKKYRLIRRTGIVRPEQGLKKAEEIELARSEDNRHILVETTKEHGYIKDTVLGTQTPEKWIPALLSANIEWEDIGEDEDSIQKTWIENQRRGYHKHDGFPEHPVRVKHHQEYFASHTEEPDQPSLDESKKDISDIYDDIETLLIDSLQEDAPVGYGYPKFDSIDFLRNLRWGDVDEKRERIGKTLDRVLSDEDFRQLLKGLNNSHSPEREALEAERDRLRWIIDAVTLDPDEEETPEETREQALEKYEEVLEEISKINNQEHFIKDVVLGTRPIPLLMDNIDTLVNSDKWYMQETVTPLMEFFPTADFIMDIVNNEELDFKIRTNALLALDAKRFDEVMSERYGSDWLDIEDWTEDFKMGDVRIEVLGKQRKVKELHKAFGRDAVNHFIEHLEFPEDVTFDTYDTFNVMKKDPGADARNLFISLYDNTPFGTLHKASMAQWEASSSSDWGGLLKESIGRQLDGDIVHHSGVSVDKLQEMYLPSRPQRLTDFGYDTEDHIKYVTTQDNLDKYVLTHQKAIRKVLDAVYPDQDTIPVYRGTSFDEVEETTSLDEFIDGKWNPIDVIGNPVSSYSVDAMVARKFASRDYHWIISSLVHKDDIWSNFWAHSYQGNEREFLIINKERESMGMRADTWDMSGKQQRSPLALDYSPYGFLGSEDVKFSFSGAKKELVEYITDNIAKNSFSYPATDHSTASDIELHIENFTTLYTHLDHWVKQDNMPASLALQLWNTASKDAGWKKRPKGMLSWSGYDNFKLNLIELTDNLKTWTEVLEKNAGKEQSQKSQTVGVEKSEWISKQSSRTMLVPYRTMVHRPTKTPYFATRWKRVTVPQRTGTAYNVIPVEEYKGNIQDIYSSWQGYVGDSEEGRHDLYLPIIALQEIIYKGFDGLLATFNNRIVGVVSLHINQAKEARLSILSASPFDIIQGTENRIEDMLRRGVEIYVKNKGWDYIGIDAEDEEDVDIEKARGQLIPVKVPITLPSGKKTEAIRWKKGKSDPKAYADFDDVFEALKDDPKMKAYLEGVITKVPSTWQRETLELDMSTGNNVIARAINSFGKWSYIHSTEKAGEKKEAKHNKVEKFNKALPKIRNDIERGMKKGDEEAIILHLIDVAGLRIGDELNNGEAFDRTQPKNEDGEFPRVPTYAARQLLGKHVSVDGTKVRLQYPGKDNVPIDKTIDNALLAKFFSDKKKTAGDDDKLFEPTSGKVRGYFQKLGGGNPFKVHNFRHHHATRLIVDKLKDYPMPTVDSEDISKAVRRLEVKQFKAGGRKKLSQSDRKKIVVDYVAKQFKKHQLEVAKTSAEFLAHTPQVSFDDYILPTVWAEWDKEQGNIVREYLSTPEPEPKKVRKIKRTVKKQDDYNPDEYQPWEDMDDFFERNIYDEESTLDEDDDLFPEDEEEREVQEKEEGESDEGWQYPIDLSKAVTSENIAQAKAAGLVPQSGNWQKPKRWVRPEDVEETDYKEPFSEVFEDYLNESIKEDFTMDTIWEMDSSEGAKEVRDTFQKLLGENLSPRQVNFINAVADNWSSWGGSTGTDKNGNPIKRELRSPWKMKDFLREINKDSEKKEAFEYYMGLSQRLFGNKPKVLYRGLREQKSRVKVGDTIKAKTHFTSSWTTDRNVALGFSSTTGKRTGKGLILSKEFNPEDILMVPMMGNGNHSEKFDWQKEFVVMSKEGSFDDVMVEEILEW